MSNVNIINGDIPAYVSPTYSSYNVHASKTSKGRLVCNYNEPRGHGYKYGAVVSLLTDC